jgi:outer membrane autotransporter protein
MTASSSANREGYVDSGGTAVPSSSETQASIRFGTKLAYHFIGGPDSPIEVLQPYLKLDGVFDVADEDNFSVTGTSTISNSELHASVGGGVSLLLNGGMSLELGMTYDGLGDNDYEAIGGRLAITIPLN